MCKTFLESERGATSVCMHGGHTREAVQACLCDAAASFVLQPQWGAGEPARRGTLGPSGRSALLLRPRGPCSLPVARGLGRLTVLASSSSDVWTDDGFPQLPPEGIDLPGVPVCARTCTAHCPLACTACEKAAGGT